MIDQGTVDAAVKRMQLAVDRRAAALAERCVVDGRVSVARLDANQEAAYHLAFLATEAAAAAAVTSHGVPGDVDADLALLAVADLARSARARLDGRPGGADLRGDPLDVVLRAGSEPALVAAVAGRLAESARRDLPSDAALVADSFARFAADEVAPVAEAVHRYNQDVPEHLIDALAALGAFGMSIPPEYGGFRDADDHGTLPMVVATEELSRASLMAGSLLTRPEILVTALLEGGTEEQKQRWLPAIASGEKMVAVAVTEPDFGSDVAALTTRAQRVENGYALKGTKTWATFAGRAELLMVLARTDPDHAAGAHGLSLFVVEKPAFDGTGFELDQPDGGRMSARAIDTIGYRGLHSFEVTFEDWLVPPWALIGGEEGAGKGFFLQMGAFATGRLQTAARALGVMEAAFDEGRDYAAGRIVFGRPLLDFPLTRATLARMAGTILAGRRLTYLAAERLDTREGQRLAAMAKAFTSRAAEGVARDAMQLHGGYGYAEEYPISRLFVDARVLSIFEGTEEILALRVIARDLLIEAAGG